MSPAVAPVARSPSLHMEHCGKYRLIATLGQGGMADVFLAVIQGAAGFKKLQVIKRLRANLAEEPELLSMFLDEARLAARLNHRNVVQTNEVGETNGQYFLAMEYLEGQPLNRIIRQTRKSSSPQQLRLMLRIIADALAGLHYAHELANYDGTPLNIVHRDASPHNIFVTYEGETKVVDFGIAKAATQSVETRNGLLKGKVSYMAPEQASGMSVDRRADVFVLGAILWEMIANRKMWDGLSDIDILQRLINGQIPRLPSALPHPPDPALIEICSRATMPDRESRYATAAEMRGAILHYLSQSGENAYAEAVGKFVSATFADKRNELRKTIERQLGRLTASDAAPLLEELPQEPVISSLPLLDVSTEMSEHTPSRLQSHSQPHSQSQLLRLSQSSPGRAQPTSDLMQALPAPPSAPSGLMSTQPSSPTSLRPTSAPARPRYGLLGIVLGTAILTVTGMLVFSKRAHTDSTSVNTDTGAESAPSLRLNASTPPVSAPAPVQKGDVLELRISAAPRSAMLSLDGAALPSNPFVAKFPVDHAGHRVRAEASGYDSQAQIVIFDKDVELALDLTQPKSSRAGRGRTAALPPPPPPTPVASPPAADAPTATVDPNQAASLAASPRKHKRALDSANPWESSPPAASTGAPAKPKRALDSANPW